MLKRPFCGMAVCFLAGILGAAYLDINAWQMWLGISALSISGMYLAKHFEGNVRRIRLRICLCVLMILLGYWQYQGALTQREVYLSALQNDMSLMVQGQVARKQYQNNQYIYELTSCYLEAYQNKVIAQKPIFCNRVLAYSDSDVASVGEILVLNGTVKLWECAANEGNFDAKAFYLARGIAFRLSDVEVLSRHGNVCTWREALVRLRVRLQAVYQNTMSEETGGVIATMVLGDKTLLNAEIKQLYQMAGLSHVMAISGIHISIIGMSLYRFMRKRGLGFGIAGAVAGTLLYMYGTMVGMGTSVQRSVGMFVLQLLAQWTGRSYDTLNALGIMAIGLLWENPFLLWDAGFQFSFAAILGVAWLGNCMSFEDTPYQKWKEKLFVSGGVQMATLPLVAWNYFEVPVYAMLINLLVLPFMGSVLALGIAGGFAGLFSLKAAGVLLFFCEKILALIQKACTICEGLPMNMMIVGRPGLLQVLLYYVLLIGAAIFSYRKKERIKKEKEQINSGRQRGVRMLFTVCSLLILLFYPASQRTRIDILDVGQGDAIFGQTADGRTIFVDGGSSSVSQVGTYRILPFLKYHGVKKIDFWIVSHTDDDHISGLREILTEGYPIGQLVFAQGIVQDEAFLELSDLTRANDTEILYLTAGDILHLGEAKIHMLYPEIGSGKRAYSTDGKETDKNAASLVFLYEEGEFSALFTGDIGNEQEEELCAVMTKAYETGKIADKDLDVYKAAHHGSKNSNAKEWLDLLKPCYSVVSCAKKNRYGHPAPEAVAHMKEAGSEVFYTMESGQITIEVCDNQVVVIPYKRE